MNRSKKYALATGGVLIVCLTLFASGCIKNYRTSYRDVTFWIEPSNTEIVAGEMVTAITRSTNTAGHEVDIVWTSNGGELEVIQDGRAARVQFDSSGMYSIKAKLYLDEVLVDIDTTYVTVKPLS